MRKSPEPLKCISVVLTEELYGKLREHEVATKWNISATVREALKEYFGKDKEKPKGAKNNNRKQKD